jgi:hypothetical protein
MMVEFGAIADKVKDVDKIKISDIKKETEMKVKMIDVVERLSKKYASGLDKNKAEFLTNDAITIQFEASPYEVILREVNKDRYGCRANYFIHANLTTKELEVYGIQPNKQQRYYNTCDPLQIDFTKITFRFENESDKLESKAGMKMLTADCYVEMASEVIDKSMEFLQTALSTFNEYKKNVQIKMIPFKNASLRDGFSELPTLQKFDENYKKVCKMIENKEITEINDDDDFFERLSE